IEAGDAETGITIMQMDEGLDTGPMLLVEREPIRADDTGGSLHDRLAALGARAIVSALDRLRAGTLRAQPQPADGVTYAHKLTRADASIDWAHPARRIVDRVRAFDPVPGATAVLERMPDAPIKVWAAAVAAGDESGRASAAAPLLRPGTVLLADPGRLVVACGDGAIELRELQRPGSRRLPAEAFLRGCPVEAGERFVMSAAT
ncbi:MAG TPA: methionyl-tRNA formyltransferase, partial [Zeimonas sp.]|nr:methionyl-tRNA formyltransferase [Zeimonas sp.]